MKILNIVKSTRSICLSERNRCIFLRSCRGFALAVSCSLFCLTLFCGQSERKYSSTYFSLDTKIDVTVYSFKNPSLLLDSFGLMVAQYDSSISISNPKSDIWKINHRINSGVHVRPFTVSMLSFCIDQAGLSGGLFDITVAPLKYLYGLESHQTTHTVPTQAQLDSVRRFIGIKHLRIMDDTTVFIDSGVTIDLGGIAKGFLLEKTQKLFIDAGYNKFMVNLGGDLVVWDKKPGNRLWNVGIRYPRNGDMNMAVLPASNTCVFTSGDDERYFVKDGIIYHHLFNPLTACPGRKNRSSTVIYPDPVIADVAVKVSFLMDAPLALEYLAGKKIPGIIVDSTGVIWASKSLKPVIKPDSTMTINYK
ncbi:MAG TPA: hypothetical protein DCO75_11450 [Fibrobacteres bacterium]|jgi:FAD:protein FMN transferase|nr:hypothetical protein [Fibrobacterota bacterium]